MAVLVEGYSLIIRRRSVKRRFRGGVDRFLASIPNGTLCYDDDLYRVGFLDHSDLLRFEDFLEDGGLTHLDDGVPIDMIAVSQINGPECPCDWMEFVEFRLDGDPNRTVGACCKPGSRDDCLVTPKGWSYEESLYASGMFLTDSQARANLIFIRCENNIEIYQHRETDKYYYLSRAERPDGREEEPY